MNITNLGSANYVMAVEVSLIVEREGIVIDEPVFYQGKRPRGITPP